MRFSLKTLLVFPLVAAITYWIVLPVIYSERYYVLSNLHIKGWDLSTIGEKELDQIIFGEESNSFYLSKTTDGIAISAQMFGVAFSTDSTRWQYTKAVEKVDEAMQALLKRHPDLAADCAAVEVYALDATGNPDRKVKRQMSYTRFENYPQD